MTSSDSVQPIRRPESVPVQWHEPAIPQSAIQMIPVSAETGEILMLHRSPAVRSAANCWSFPSGLHDVGKTINDIIIQELDEELNLKDPISYTSIGVYENIAGDEPSRKQYHWVINVVVVQVESFKDMVNNEPDKHDEILLLPGHMPFQADFFDLYKFHPTFEQWGRGAFKVLERALYVLQEGGQD